MLTTAASWDDLRRYPGLRHTIRRMRRGTPCRDCLARHQPRPKVGLRQRTMQAAEAALRSTWRSNAPANHLRIFVGSSTHGCTPYGPKNLPGPATMGRRGKLLERSWRLWRGAWRMATSAGDSREGRCTLEWDVRLVTMHGLERSEPNCTPCSAHRWVRAPRSTKGGQRTIPINVGETHAAAGAAASFLARREVFEGLEGGSADYLRGSQGAEG